MTKTQNLSKLRKWGNYAYKKTNWLLKEKGKPPKEVMKSEKYCGKTATLPAQGSANKPPGITLR